MIKRALAIVCCTLLWYSEAQPCTSAIVSAEASGTGRPMLWKHRDTSTIDNVVDYIQGKNGDYSYVALFNANDRKREQAWTGMNEVGFAVMNTASYNIKDDNVSQKKMDREGYVMTIALRSCRTVDDFAKLLETLPRPMGVEANFGVIDASGAGAYFETNNHSYKRYDLKDAPGGVLIRTNYSHSGRPDEGYGFIREANAEHILAPFIASRSVTPEVLTEVASRSFYHDLKAKDFEQEKDIRWVVDQDFIPRFKSTATIVIEGCEPLADAMEATPEMVKKQYIMWTGLGYPPCAEIVPVWCSQDGVDIELQGIGKDGHSPLADRAKARRGEVFPIKKGNGDHYIDMRKLFNEEGTGYVQILRKQNHEVYDRFGKR